MPSLKTCIYFALESSSQYLKIGCTSKPGRRLGWLRLYAKRRFGSTDVEYLGIVRGGFETEERLHRRFRRFAIGGPAGRPGTHGEWFRADPVILNYIKSQRHRFCSIESFYCQRVYN